MLKIKERIKKNFFIRFVRLSVNNTFRIGRTLDIQLKNSKISKSTTYNGIKVFVPLIETNHYQFFQILIICKALQIRGADVKVLVCNSQLDGCEIKSIKNDKFIKCLECTVNSKFLLKKFNLDIIYINDLVDKKSFNDLSLKILNNHCNKFIYHGINITPIVNDSVTRYFYGAVPNEGSIELNNVRLMFIKSALISTECAVQIEKLWSPNIVFGSMNVYCDWAPYHKIHKNNGKKVSTLSITPFNYKSVVVNSSELYESSDRFNKWVNMRKNKFLIEDEKFHLDKVLNERFSGNIPAFKIYNFYKRDNSFSKYLNIDKGKRNIFLFTNIYWDVGISDSGFLYDDVIKWVLDTINFVKNDKNLCLYIKTHPAEVFDSSTSLKGVKDFIYSEYDNLPSNVYIIDPAWKINTYNLFPLIDVGVVYNGTVGLEMMLHGIPVIVTGKAPYSNIGIANEPLSKYEYYDMLLNKRVLIEPFRLKTELFAYFYFIKSCIPWSLTAQAYGYHFKEFSFNNLEDILEGKDKTLDHICNSIIFPDKTIPEAW